MLLSTHSLAGNKVMTGDASPNQTIMFSLMKFATAPPVALQSGMAFAHLVKYFVAMRIHMYLWEGGLTGPTKSSL